MNEKTICILYDYLGLDDDDMLKDIIMGYLTENDGRDGKTYYVYFDGVKKGAISVETNAIITDDTTLDNLFF